MRIDLPESVMTVVRERVEAGGYASPEEYLAALVAADAAALPDLTDEDRKRLGDLALAAFDEGQAGIVADDAYGEALRRRVREGPGERRADAS